MPRLNLALCAVAVPAILVISMRAFHSADTSKNPQATAITPPLPIGFTQSFLTSAVNNCEDTAKRAVENKGRKVDDLLQTRINAACECAANNVAQTLTKDDIEAFKTAAATGNLTPHLSEIVAKATGACFYKLK